MIRDLALERSKEQQRRIKAENAAWRVEVVSYDTGEVEHAIPCGTKRGAERVENGININLNHGRYFTRIAATGDTP